MTYADLLVRNALEVITCAGPAPRRGRAQADVTPVADGAVASLDGRIVFVGTTGECSRAVALAPGAMDIDAAGCTVVPGFVDAHTHLVHAGDRRSELRRRLAGATYAQIAQEGGGILRTVQATREASEAELVALGLVRLGEMLRCGTTTCEVKSGYGLTVESELKLLRVVRRLAAAQPVALVPTFMGAHEVPPEYRTRREAYVHLVISEMIPRVAAAGLAEWCDVFCEEGVFGIGESRDILRAGQAAGLRARVHAEELAASGGARLAAELGARSADHLVHVDRDSARAMAAADTVATLLPAAAFFLKLGRYAPARMLIDEGVAVALSTDVNPGGGYSPSMPFAITLSCFGMGLTLEEALVAATLNAAYSLDRHEQVGSLERGKRMDAVLIHGAATELLRPDALPVRAVIKAGRVVSEAPDGRA